MTEIFLFVIGFAIGYLFLAVSVARAIEANKLSLPLVKTKEKVELEQIEYVLERHNTTLYAFDTADTFIAQGTTYAELSANMTQRFPDNSFKLVRYSSDISDEMLTKLAAAFVAAQAQRSAPIQETDDNVN
jgi:hypothetical protein